jgi:parallel beta-helix repeat protein
VYNHERANMEKNVVIGIIILIVGISIVPNVVSKNKINEYIIVVDHNRAYYSNIQDAIDNASNGDTIYVSSGVYYENIIVDKMISLVGENKSTTIIDGGNKGTVVYISADSVNINGFTIRNSEVAVKAAGIYVISNFCSINNNIITNELEYGNAYGLFLSNASNNSIIKNNIENNYQAGIHMEHSSNNKITSNIIYNNLLGSISLGWSSDYNKISNNSLNDLLCICLLECYCNIISYNNILTYGIGVLLANSSYNEIIFNNLIKDEQNNPTALNAIFFNCQNLFNGNYWNRARLLPFPVLGKIKFKEISTLWFNFDRHPAHRPYEINV